MAFDLLIIGGGINGAGIARDAALRGLSTCLVEQGDLCQGTTRWSSRLIHGGLRYLEFGELGLVHESLAERENLLRNAPHLVRPLPLLIPVYDHSRRGLNTVDFGLWVYDLLSRGSSLPGHRRLSTAEALASVPGLEATGLAGALLYHDAQAVWVERLVVENAVAARNAGAAIRTYTRVGSLLRKGNRVIGALVRDLASGTEDTIEARLVINAAGPWVDRVLAGAGQSLPRFLGPTKGTHIVLPRLPGFGTTACYAEARADGRPFFVLPWNDLVLVGTTDTRSDVDPGQLRPTEAEIDYLLAETRALLPDAGLHRDQVLYAYAGLRPLPRQGLRATAAVTRRHVIRRHGRSARGLYSVIGGKLSTYRHLAEDAVDQATAALGGNWAACSTASAPLPGGIGSRDEVLAALAQFPALGSASREHLWQVYGSRAVDVARLTRDAPDLASPLAPATAAIGAELVHATREEWAGSLGDLLLRRCMVGLGADLGLRSLPGAIAVARQHLGWSAERAQVEEAAYRTEIGRLQPAFPSDAGHDAGHDAG